MPTNLDYEKAAQEKYGDVIPKEERAPDDIKNLMYNKGYIPVNMENLPSKGRFYPADAKISIKAASVSDIEHWSMMNPDDLLDVNSHYKDILLKCCKIKSMGKDLSVRDILEADKMFLILSIKDLTFTKSENIINLNIKCNHCGHENEKELSNNILDSISEADPQLEKYYDSIERKYVIKTKSYGEIRMKPPTIGIFDFVLTWGRKCTMESRDWNKAFFQLLPFLDIDWRECSTYVDKKGITQLGKEFDMHELEFSRYDSKKRAIVMKMAELMKIGIDPIIKIKCSDCGEEVQTPFQFPDGPKSLFIIQNISDELI